MYCIALFFFSLLIILRPSSSSKAGLLEDAARLPLLTAGSKLVDQDGAHVKLACVNWYGAHMELFSVHGLHKRGLEEIVQDIVDAGFNCVRMPYSLDLTFRDTFIVPDFALEANPALKGKSGIEIFHLTMKEMTDKKLLVFLNNHNSVAAWCCNKDSEDGIWSNDAYSAEEWMESLVYLADYYKDNKHVIGMDLRNEIHDVKNKGRFITWGANEDIDNDWKHATEVASKRIYDVNPDWLIIVSGMCFSFDLRTMVDNMPDIPQDRKLVWTVHYYSFSRWWVKMGDKMSQGFEWDGGSKETWEKVASYCVDGIVIACVTLAVVASALVARSRLGMLRNWYFVPREKMVRWAANGGTVCLWCAVIGVGLNVFAAKIREGYDAAGCAVMALEADAMDIVRYLCFATSALGGVVSVGTLVAVEKKGKGKGGDDSEKNQEIEMVELKNGGGAGGDKVGEGGGGQCHCCDLLLYSLILNLFILCLLALSGCSAGLVIARKTTTYQMLHDELYFKWGKLAGSAPVLVGEFGSGGDGMGASDDWWHQMMRFLKEYDLDYAYWPWNGEKWNNGTYEYQNEGYGLVTTEWDEIRHPGKLADLMALN